MHLICRCGHPKWRHDEGDIKSPCFICRCADFRATKKSSKEFIWILIAAFFGIVSVRAGYFAEVKNGVVQRVIVADSQAWCEKTYGGQWVETFQDDPNKNFAGPGFEYLPARENFAAPKPYASWMLDSSCKWQPPKTPPILFDGTMPFWDETIKDWKTK